MIAVLLLILFGLTCLWLIADSLSRRTGMIEFPFLAACGMLGFIFPQAVGVVRNPQGAPYGGLVKSLVMCILCLAAAYWGWHARVPARWRRPSRLRCAPGLAYACALALIAIGVVAFLKLASLTGGVTDYFSVHGAYALKWRGLPVVYTFFIGFITPGVTLAFLSAPRLRFPGRYIPPVLALGVPVGLIVFLGRRSNVVTLCTLVLCVLYFARGWLPRPWVAFVALPLLAAAMFLMPYYRAYSEIGANHAKLNEMPVKKTTQETLQGQQEEFWAMTYIVQITDLTGHYDFGRGLYNSFIQLFVPKLIVGKAGKESLYWGHPGEEYHENDLGWAIPYGMDPTGPGTAYHEFWFLGAIWFILLARGLRYLFVRSCASRNLFFQAAYAASLAPAIFSMITDMNAIYGFLFVIAPVLILCRLVAGLPQGSVQSALQRVPGRPSPITTRIQPGEKAEIRGAQT